MVRVLQRLVGGEARAVGEQHLAGGRVEDVVERLEGEFVRVLRRGVVLGVHVAQHRLAKVFRPPVLDVVDQDEIDVLALHDPKFVLDDSDPITLAASESHNVASLDRRGDEDELRGRGLAEQVGRDDLTTYHFAVRKFELDVVPDFLAVERGDRDDDVGRVGLSADDRDRVRGCRE